jgi:hypothetical protein
MNKATSTPDRSKQMIGEDADFSPGLADTERGLISHVFFHKAPLESYQLLNEIGMQRQCM